MNYKCHFGGQEHLIDGEWLPAPRRPVTEMNE